MDRVRWGLLKMKRFNFTLAKFGIDRFSFCVSYFWVGLLRLVSTRTEIYTAFRYDALSEVRKTSTPERHGLFPLATF